MDVTCQFSLYLLRVEHLSPAIDSALAAIADHGLSVTAGPLSSTIVGAAETVFTALRDAYAAAAEHGDCILTTTVSNACADPRPDRDMLPAREHVLAVCAHPDDESFGLGAVISTLREHQTVVDLACFSRGEASTLGGDEPSLRNLRTVELANATQELGIRHVQIGDYPDGQLTGVPIAQLASFIRPLASEADALLVFDDSGITGHPDHKAATAAALHVAEELDLTVAWTLPTKVADALNAEFGSTFIGRPDDHIDLNIAVDRATQSRAIAHHASQLRNNPIPHRRLDLTGDTEYLRYLRRTSREPGWPNDRAATS